ncbi:MAG TPA: pantoate--beta-alanine ligase [Planctomycetota bacterium]|nr:pantoate--beta-alanine ligase [Planctomycetota bacterium]
MKLVTAIESMAKERDELRRAGKRVGFVPTMGALHAGHESLVRRARSECDFVVASVFVNPLQFGAGEDFSRYPRDLEGDRAKLAACGCDLLFTTTPGAMYPHGFQTYVVPDGPLVARYEASARPGHFRGVATVVLKLLHLVGPDRAYFGRKDAQQSAVVRRMVADLNAPVAIVVAPTVREADGLAMSSRNAYLSPAERAAAPAIHRALASARERAKAGERDPARLLAAIDADLRAIPGGSAEYVALVDPDTFEERAARLPERLPPTLAVTAVRLGATRLLDNLRLDEDGP